MATADKRTLHWTQQIALTRHNLHAASRSGDFSFFTHVQAHHFIHGTDHIAALEAAAGDNADRLLSVLDNLSSAIAWVHEDAFKAAYDNYKGIPAWDAAQAHNSLTIRFHADLAQQRATADNAIDKLVSSAVTVIHQQPGPCQNAAASVFLLGTTFAADAVQVCLAQLAVLDSRPDPARADAAWDTVRRSVSAAVAALKGILHMMDSPDDSLAAATTRRDSLPTAISSPLGRDIGIWGAIRRMSSALGTDSHPQSRKTSIASTVSAPPLTMSTSKHTSFPAAPLHVLSPIQATPADVHALNPFETSFSQTFRDPPADNDAAFASNTDLDADSDIDPTVLVVPRSPRTSSPSSRPLRRRSTNVSGARPPSIESLTAVNSAAMDDDDPLSPVSAASMAVRAGTGWRQGGARDWQFWGRRWGAGEWVEAV